MADFTDRLKQAMARAGVETRALANELGVSYQAINKLLHGTSKSLSAKNNVKAASFLKVSAAWLATGRGDMLMTPAPESADNFTEVHRAQVKFSNGTGQLVYFVEDAPPLMFRKDFLSQMHVKPDDAVVVTAAGISNAPRIVDGAVVLVNRADREPLDGSFFAFRVDGELFIKRLEKIQGVGVLATADNTNFTPRTRVYNHGSDFEVIGRAVWVGAVL